jgi:YYY domain-containing protein
MLDVLLWYLWAQAFGLGGWLILSRWLRALPDRGYGLSKAFGLLLGGFAYWWLITLGLAPNTPGAALLALALVYAAGLGFTLTRQPPAASRQSLAPIIVTELLFGLGFLAWAVFRSYNPDITESGGEKFMEIMMLNAILRSPSFPPNDAWLSGFTISYYYFGYVILAMLTRVSGVAPAIGFNLGNALFFALVLSGAFSLGFNLWALRERHQSGSLPDRPPRAAAAAGLLTAAMLAMMGNLGGLMESARCARLLPAGFWEWLDVRQIAAQSVECEGLRPLRFYWWWDWSRVVHDYTPAGADQEAITETPVFSFLLGDNHPHVMGLAFVLAAAGLALNAYAGARRGVHWAADLALTAVVLGGLAFLNTWDLPVYAALLAGGLLIGQWLRRRPLIELMASAGFAAAAVALGYLLYLPFYATFSSQAAGIGINLFNGTRWIQFLLMFAPFAVAFAAFLPLAIGQARAEGRATALGLLARAAALVAIVALGLLLGVAAALLFWPEARTVAAEVMNGGEVYGVTRDIALGRLAERLADPWVPLTLIFGAALSAMVIAAWRLPGRAEPGRRDEPGSAPAPISPVPFVLLLFTGGALLAAAVEFVYLRDMFGTRMNTLFKFYYQAWTVWAVASGFGLMALASERRWWTWMAAAAGALLVAAGLLYPLYGVQSRIEGYTGQPTLDGARFVQNRDPDDARAIAWLNANVRGAPVIAEAPADQHAAYSYQGRISAFTGLPTLLGWGGHQNQWRGNYDEPARREPLIEVLFGSADDAAARQVLHEFGVRYVIVGKAERERYPAEALAKFERLGRSVYRSGGTVVYEITGD